MLLLIVLLSPFYLRGVKLNYRHLLGGALGFAGAALIINGDGTLPLVSHGLFEIRPLLLANDLTQLALLGISFYCWNAAMKRGGALLGIYANRFQTQATPAAITDV